MNEATVDFIRAHADDNVRQLALKGTKNPDVDLTFALDQIAGHQTARRKLPTWAATDGIVFPPHLSMEQCSSEQTARYKARIAGVRGERILEERGEKREDIGGERSVVRSECMVDLTGGFGVDFSFLAPLFDEAVYVERQSALCDIARHNFHVLGLQATIVNGDAVDYLRQMDRANLIYIDPARRDLQGQRTYGISDCTPDVVALRDLLLEKADRVIIKLSPMLDWRKAVQDLSLSPNTPLELRSLATNGTQEHLSPCVSEVHIVSVGNECKELLLVLENREERGDEGEPKVFCVNDETVFVVGKPSRNYQGNEVVKDILKGSFLYEPNASIMKVGCFEAVSEAFDVCPIAPNSHLFVCDRLIGAFPGRTFIIDDMTTMNKRELRTALAGISRANITVRNFPLTVAQLRSRLKLGEGGSTYIFATTLADNRHVLLVCSKTELPV